MKPLIVSALAAVLIHIALFLIHPVRQKPGLALPPTRSVRVSLTTAPEPERVKPLPVSKAAPVAPLATLALKEPPPPAPAPVPKPLSKPAHRPEPRKAASPPAEATPPAVSDASPEDTPPREEQEADRTETAAQADASQIEAAALSQGADPVQVERTAATYDFNPPPEYPPLARRRQYQGTVLLNVLVDVHGKAAKIELIRSSGHAVLDRRAESSVSQWRFQPATLDGKAIESWVEVPIQFKLE